MKTKEQLLFIKKTAEENLAGAYDPTKLTKAVQLITGVSEPMPLRRKRQTLMAYFNYKLNDEMKAVDKTELAVEPPISDSEPTHNEDNGSDMARTKTEEVKMEKPKSKRKKRVTKPTNQSNLKLDA